MIDALRDGLAWIGLIALGWLAVSCIASYLKQPERRVPRPNVRSQRYEPDQYSRWHV